MSTSTPDAPNVEVRLERLEKRLQQLGRLFAWFATLCICFMIFGVAQFFGPKWALSNGVHYVEANRFRLRDPQDKTLAVLEGRTFSLYDGDNKLRASLGMDPEEGMRLRFYDANGQSRTALGVTKEGLPFIGITDSVGKPSGALTIVEKGGGGLVLWDGGTNPRVMIGTNPSPDGQRIPTISVFDPGGNAAGILSVTDDGPLLMLISESKKAGVALSMSKKDGPYVQIKDENGKERAKLNLTKEGATFMLLDEEGKPVFSKP